MKIKIVGAERFRMLRRLALCALVLLVACGRSDGAVENLGSRFDKAVEDPNPGPTPPPPLPPRPSAVLAWPSTPVIASEITGTLPGSGSVSGAGDYRYTLPIEVPSGRAGMAPSLSLSYSSSGANGIAGVGWSLTGVSAIKACNKTFSTDGKAQEAPTSEEMWLYKYNSVDTNVEDVEKIAWCLDGRRLVSTGEDETYNGAFIHVLRTESDTFARVEQSEIQEFSSPGSTYFHLRTTSFKVFLKDGRIQSYTPAGDLLNEFLLAKEEDRFGNTITYSYTPPSAAIANADPDHLAPLAIAEETALLATIHYTGRVSSGDIGSRIVWLKYEDRPDPIFMTDSFPVTSSKKRLQSIDCYAPTTGTGTSVGAPVLAWSYVLSYVPSTASGRSRLTSVKRKGLQGSEQYAKLFDWDSTVGGVYNSPNYALPQGDTAGNFVVLDADHDGRDELLYSPQGPFSPHVMYSTVGAGLPLSKTTPITGLSNATLTDASIGDVDGDGLPEIIAPDRNANAVGNKAYRIYTWSSTMKDYNVTTQVNNPWVSYLDPSSNNVEQPIFLVDMDGDGLPDMFQAQYPFHDDVNGAMSCVGTAMPDRPKCLWGDWYYFHNNGGNFGTAQPSLVRHLGSGTDHLVYPPRSGSPFAASVLADRAGRSIFTGASEYDAYWGSTLPRSLFLFGDDDAPSTRWGGYDADCVYGNFTGRGNEPVCDHLPYPWRTTVFDSDSDGRDELFEYVSQNINGMFAVTVSKRVYFDNEGTRHEDQVTQTPLTTGDFNGDGFQDAIFYDPTQQKTFAALNAGPTRDLMVGVRDETAFKPMEIVTYSQRWSADEVYGKICSHPQTCLRQGMNVVVEHDVYQGSDVDTYEHNFFNYEDPRMDVHGRGFLGFATVRSWNPDRLSETITEYDNTTSVNGVYLASMPSRVSHYMAIVPVANTPRKYTVRGSVVNTRYTVDKPTPSTYFRHPTTWDSVEWETNATIDVTTGVARHFLFTGPTPTPLRQRNGEFLFDEYGNQTYSRAETFSGVKTEVIATYDNLPHNWLIGKLTQTQTSVTEPGSGIPTPRRVDYVYGSNGEMLSSTIEKSSSDASIKYTTSFKYNNDGLLIVKTGSQSAYLSPLPPGAPLPPGDADRSEYTEYDPDEGIFPRKIWNDLGHVTRVLYHPAFGTISTEINANGVETQIVFDGLGRAQKIMRAGESPVFIHLGPRKDANGKLIGSSVDTSGAGVVTTHSEYDEYGRVVLQNHIGFDGTGIYSQKKYDGLGRLNFSSRSGFGQPAATGTTYAYDGLGRVTTVTPPDANVNPTRVTHTFFETRTKDAVNHESYVERDLDGRLVKSVGVGDNGDSVVKFNYGNFNQIKTIIDSKNNASRIYYDQRGRRVEIHDPDAGATTLHYNAFGDLTELDTPGINGSGVPAQTFYRRDALGRVVHIDNGDGATDFTWDTSPYGVGLLASQTSPWVAQTFEYDWYGRPASETWRVDNESFNIRTSYDAAGRVSTVSYPEVPGRPRFTVQRNYTSTNYFASVAEVDLSAPITFWQVQARNADDQLLVGQFGNERLSKRSYDSTFGRLKSIVDMGCVGVNCIGEDYSLGYTYLDDGNVDSRTDYVVGRVEKFSYDALNRLKSWNLTYAGSTRTTSYGYDEIGNIKDVKVGGLVTESNSYYPSGGVPCAGGPSAPCPGPHALESTTVGGETQNFGYDTRGRQISTPGRRVAFSEANLPTSIITAAGSTVFSYDAAGSRVKKVGPSEETLTLGGLYERRTTQSETQHVFFVSGGDGNMTQVSFAQGSLNTERVEYLHTDALGSTGAVTDATGSITRFYHEPFGARINADGSAFSGTLGDVRFGFTGHISDDDIALVNMKGRIYDPSQRHFISPDPLVSAPANAQSYNRYSYVNNNPLYYTDPSGFGDEPAPPPPSPPDSVDNHTSTGGPPITGQPGFSTSDPSPSAPTKSNGRAPATPYKAASVAETNAGSSGTTSDPRAATYVPRECQGPYDGGCSSSGGFRSWMLSQRGGLALQHGFLYMSGGATAVAGFLLVLPASIAGVATGGWGLIGGGAAVTPTVAAATPTVAASVSTAAAAVGTPVGQEILQEAEEFVAAGSNFGQGAMAHFTNASGVTGITGVNPATLSVGERVTVQVLRFGQGVTDFMSEKGRIFVTELGPEVSYGDLNQIGVFGDKQQYVIQFSREAAFFNGIRPVAESAARSIFTIPGGSTFLSSPDGAGPFHYYVIARW